MIHEQCIRQFFIKVSVGNPRVAVLKLVLLEVSFLFQYLIVIIIICHNFPRMTPSNPRSKIDVVHKTEIFKFTCSNYSIVEPCFN